MVKDGQNNNLWMLIIKSRINILVFFAYSILSIIFTYPVAFSFNKVPGWFDVYQFLWFLWWFKKALLSFANPYYTPYLFYPSGVNLAFSELTPFNSIASIPLQQLFGLVPAYNVLWIFSFIISGYGTFLLVKYLTKDSRAAFVSGLIFAYCPYRFAHALTSLNLISTEWIPFYVLFLIKMTREDKMVNALYAAFFLILTAMSSNIYAVYMWSFTLLYILYYLLFDKSLIKKVFIKKIFIMSISFVIGFFPFLYILLKELFLSGSNYMYVGGFEEFSADLMGFFTPTVLHPIFKDLFYYVNFLFTGKNVSEFTVFAGYTVLLLSIIAILKVKTIDIKFWTLSAITFFILCLGPNLHIFGVTNFSLGGHYFTIPLPYQILMHIPVFSLARIPSRWDVLVMLSLAILAGYGINYIFSKIKIKSLVKSSKENLIVIMISCLILFEFLAIPFPMGSSEIPSIYKQMANDADDYAIVEIPFFADYKAGQFQIPMYRPPDYMYFQTIHGKKLINGYVSRTPDYVLEFSSKTPLISDLGGQDTGVSVSLSDTSMMGDIFKQNRTEILSLLNYYNIKYIILHKVYLSEKEFSTASNLIHDTLGIEPIIFDGDGLWVYPIPVLKNSSQFMYLGSGFYYKENWPGSPIRWMQADANILLYSPENRTAILNMETGSAYRSRTLEIYVGDTLEAQVVVPTNPFNVTPPVHLSLFQVTVPVHLVKGANTVRLHVPEGCEGDSRCVSLAIQNLSVI